MEMKIGEGGECSGRWLLLILCGQLCAPERAADPAATNTQLRLRLPFCLCALHLCRGSGSTGRAAGCCSAACLTCGRAACCSHAVHTPRALCPAQSVQSDGAAACCREQLQGAASECSMAGCCCPLLLRITPSATVPKGPSAALLEPCFMCAIKTHLAAAYMPFVTSSQRFICKHCCIKKGLCSHCTLHTAHTSTKDMPSFCCS